MYGRVRVLAYRPREAVSVAAFAAHNPTPPNRTKKPASLTGLTGRVRGGIGSSRPHAAHLPLNGANRRYVPEDTGFCTFFNSEAPNRQPGVPQTRMN